jgi:hypothetical protein
MTDGLQPFDAAQDVLVAEHGSEIFQAGGRVVQRDEDRLPFVAAEGEDPIVLGERLAEFHLEARIVDQARKTQDVPVGNIETAEEHRPPSVHLFGPLGKDGA